MSNKGPETLAQRLGQTPAPRQLAENAAVLAEIEDELRTMPTNIWQETQEVFSSRGRAIASVARWNGVAGERARECVRLMRDTRAPTSQQGYFGLMTVLHEARSDLRFDTLGPVNAAIGQGRVFAYFDEIRKIIELAKTDILFVDLIGMLSSFLDTCHMYRVACRYGCSQGRGFRL